MQTSPGFPSLLRHVAATIREWVTPFYTLGGAVAFVIFALTQIDPEGHLARGVMIVLLGLTALSTAALLFRARLGAWSRPLASSAVAISLIIVSTFYVAGLHIRTWVQEGPHPRGAAGQSPESTPSEARARSANVSAPPTQVRNPPAQASAARPAAHATKAPASAPLRHAAPPSGADPRCSLLVQRLSLGEALAEADMNYFRRSCGD